MKNTLVIAAREFEEKRFVAYAAVACALLPSLLTIIPGIHFRSPREMIALSALIAATGFTIALAIMSGASFVGRDLSDGRMSFYFSRPAASLSIWFGKLTASILMLVGCFAVIVAPGWLAVTRTAWTSFSTISLEEGSFLMLVLAIALFLIAHVISTFARSRSPLIVFDFVAAVICGVVIRLLVLPLFAGEAFTLLKGVGIALGVAAIIAIVGGGAWQLERGRTDRRRSHLALSQFLWATMAIALLIAGAFVAWVVSVKPRDLTGRIQASHSASGPFAVITGTAKGRSDYRPAFLLNSEDGSTWRVDSWATSSARYTRDGRSAVVPRRADSAIELLIYTRGKAEPVDTGLTISDGDYILSDDGGRIATISKSRILSVYDVATKRSMASVRLADSTLVRASFVTPDVVRTYLNVPGGVKIVELDARSRVLQDTGFIASPNFLMVYADSSAAHMLVRQAHEDRLTLNDARTGAVIRTLTNGTQVKAARYLRDGRIAIVDGPDSAAVLHILAADGTLQRDIPLGAKRATRIVGDDGTRVVLNEGASDRGTLEAVNITSGVIEHRQPIRDSVSSGLFDIRPPIEPLREVFYIGEGDRIIAWNPATGGHRTITGG